VQQRATTPIKSVDEITALLNKLGSAQGVAIDASLVEIRSQYWLARSEIRMGRGIFVNSALIQRSQTPLPNGNFTQVIWSKTGKMALD
jgi:general secretion pathway protein K